ncbi:MAG: VanZ family protein, partial [Planctomycetes bacterium]|nr:VanZ family protein [Planctomycetota bacterium]
MRPSGSYRLVTFARTATALYGLLVTYLLLAPHPLWIFGEWGDNVERSVDRTLADYVQHGVCYSIFMLLLLWSARTRGPFTNLKLACCAALVICHGLLTEFLQMFIPQRDFSVFDIAANTTGVVAIWFIAAANIGSAGASDQFPEGSRQRVITPPPRRSHLLLWALFVSSLIVYGS